MFIAAPEASAETAKVYQSCADDQGFVMNLTRAWAWRPDVYDGFAALRSQLTGPSTLSLREQAIMVCAAAAELGDSYCSLAWGRTLAKEAGAAPAAAVIQNAEHATLSARDRALAGWARQVVANPNAIQADDVNALRSAGLSEREIFEATAFVAFRLAFSTINDALGIGPDAELLAQVPPQVGAAVTYGRPVSDT